MNFKIDISATEFVTHNTEAIDTSQCEERGSIGVPYEFLTQKFGAPAALAGCDTAWALRFGDGMTALISKCGCNADDKRPNEERIAWHVASSSTEVVERLRMIVEAWDEAQDAEREAKGEQISEAEKVARTAMQGIAASEEMLDTIEAVKGEKFRTVVEGTVDIMKFRTLTATFGKAAIKGGHVPKEAEAAISLALDTLSAHLSAKLASAAGLLTEDMTQEQSDKLVDEVFDWAKRVFAAQTEKLGALALSVKR